MRNISFFIDGFNLYHSIKNHDSLKWLDLRELCRRFTGPAEKIVSVNYFTAYAHWLPESVSRHKIYVKALKQNDIDVILGKFKDTGVYCREIRHRDSAFRLSRCNSCRSSSHSHIEKETDVNIAVHLLKNAAKDLFDTAILVSGDSDLVPAVKAFKELYPNKKIGCIFPFLRHSDDLKANVDFHTKIGLDDIKNSQLPDTIISPTGIITKPEKYR